MNCKQLYMLRRCYSTAEHLKSIGSSKHLDYDIIISGGGMIGSSLACTLSRAPMLQNQKILLIEGAPKKNWKLSNNYSNRVSALNPSTKKLLESVDVWNHIKAARFKPVKQMKVWGSGSVAAVEFDISGNVSSDCIAYIVENDVLLSAIDKELDKSKDKITVIHGSKVKSYQLPTERNQPVTLVMEDGHTYSCSLLLGTDGANSKVRETMGVEYVKWSYGQHAIVANLELQELNNEFSSLVWSTTIDNSKELLKMSDEEFVHALNTALMEPPQKNSLIDVTSYITNIVFKNQYIPRPSGVIPPQIKSVQSGSRAAFPLGFGHSTSYVKPSVALLGDAAHRVHPLAGQGVNLGFGDIECLTRVLSKAVTNGHVINSFSTLKDYEKERLRHNVPTMIAIDLMNKVYSNSNSLLMALGDAAIQLANCLPPVKTLMIKQASS
ncbi:ubiquinone biosynthesis protein COQ6, mitochondrial isoform X2 [Lycorma delicatula]|uniref:ubiquinone biosynthesis protein COQ6, mitochondrial isoform X2 n=1 Tax=Lycorma delicatula TaxID=130591 RepID=UPI003F512AF3